MRRLAYGALWVFVFCIPWEKVVILPGVGVISRPLGVVAVGLTVLAVVITARVRRWRGFHVAALLFVVWSAAMSWINSSAPTLPLKFWTYSQLFLVLWMIWELGPTRKGQIGLLLAYVLGCYVTALGTIVVYRERHAAGVGRFSAGSVDPNDVAMTLALALPIAWYLAMIYRRPLLRWICRGYVPVGLLGLALTGSRGGLVTAMVALLIIPLTMTRLTPARLVSAIVVLGLTFLLAVKYVPETLVERFATTTSSVEDQNLGGRMRIWRAGVEAFAQKPLTGYGTGAFRFAAAPFLGGELRVAHNSYLSVLVEQGLVGFLFYIGMMIAVILAILDLRPLDRRFALILFATLGTAMLPLTWEDSKPVWLILAFLLGLAHAQGFGFRRMPPQPELQRAGPRVPPPRPLRPRPMPHPARQADPGAMG